ncbi:tetratricopeptide repeat protein [Rhizobium sp. P40RR-XXII]|uniref:tetratricopeptide repeat protein n=1 Tax=Rhizobium sp. P40RR-XXII TaxID=2726739 RepID=UPI001456E685|nr:tetratricopeptide repeat protein [Rhizobium sp. P40RR-XXII]NLS20377.1 tetratricopeptide repeat protein [Rhizobium sp. P40RR-XXII]
MSKIRTLLAIGALFLTTLAPALRADEISEMNSDIAKVRGQWETLKFTMRAGDKQTMLMNQLGQDADQLATKYPNHAEALIWDGIITSERASMASAFSALTLAKRARDILQKAYDIDPRALDAGAPTSLAVLYYRVPGFPLGFGDTKKARALLEEAVRSAPQGLDTQYFYGDFLYEQHEYPKAEAVLQQALKIPPSQDRPLWDHNRRLVIEQLIGKIKAKA